MNIFTLQNGLILLAVEAGLAFALWPSAEPQSSESASMGASSSDRPRQNRPIPDYAQYLQNFIDEGGNPEMAFLNYSEKVLASHRQAGLESVMALARTRDQSNYSGLFVFIAEELGLDAAVAAIPSDLDPQLNAKVAYAIALSAATKEPRKVIAFLEKTNSYLFTDAVILGKLMRSDILSLDEKIDLVRSVPQGEGRFYALDFLAQEAAKNLRQDARAALENSEIFTESQLDYYSKVYGHRLLTADFAKGIDYLQQVGYRPDLIDLGNLRQYAYMSAQKNKQQTMASIMGVPDHQVRTELMKGALDHITLTAPMEAATIAQTEFDTERDNGALLKNVYSLWFGKDSSAALAHLSSSSLTTETRDKILIDHFSVIAEHNPALAQDVVNLRPAGAVANAMRATIASTHSSNISVDQRFSNIAGITQKTQRDHLAQFVTQAVATSEPHEVLKYIERSAPSDFKDQVIKGFTRTGFYDDSFNYEDMPAIVEQIQNPQLKRELLKEWYLADFQGYDNAIEAKNAQLLWETANPDLSIEFLMEQTQSNFDSNDDE